MEAKLLESFGGKLAENWAGRVLTPALIFWVGGGLALTWHAGSMPYGQWLEAQSGTVLLLVAGAALVVIAVSGVIVSSLTFNALRLLEGYWPRWLAWLRTWSTQGFTQRIGNIDARLQELAGRAQTLSVDERAEYAGLQQALIGVPDDPDYYMPTRLGNRLRAAERRIGDKYGLEVVVCWPRLWLLLPDGTRKELSDARAQLDLGAACCLWGVLFVCWTVVAWWAAPLGLVAASAAYRWSLGVSDIYALLLESCFDVSRGLLYKSVRWPLPANPAEELAFGQALTRYLMQGSHQPLPAFIGSGAQGDN